MNKTKNDSYLFWKYISSYSYNYFLIMNKSDCLSEYTEKVTEQPSMPVNTA